MKRPLFTEMVDAVLWNVYLSKEKAKLKEKDYLCVEDLMDEGLKTDKLGSRISKHVNGKIYVVKRKIQNKIERNYTDYMIKLVEKIVNEGE